MIPKNILDIIYCSLSHINKHFVENPVALSCGHTACRKCVSKVPQPFICGECSSKIKIDLSKTKDSSIFKVSFESYFNDLFNIIYENLKSNIFELKEEVKEVNIQIDKQVELIQDEISIRIETLKASLTNLKIELFNDLEEKKEDMKNRMVRIKMDALDQDLNFLKEKLNDQNELTQKLFYEYQEKLKNLNELINEFKYFDVKKLSFLKSDLFIEKELVGEILLHFHGKLLNRVRTKPKRYFEFDFNPCSACELNNDYLLCCDNSNKRLVIFDVNFQLIKSIDRINGQPFTTLGITTNNNDRIYICDYQNHKIYATNMNFHHLKTFGDKPGSDNSSLLHPYDLFYYENSLYICDCRNQRIQKLSENLEYETSYDLNYQPWQIKITNNRACVRANNSIIYFYELPLFSLKYKYVDHDGPICVHNSYFYEFSEKHKKIFCYDWNGKIDEEAELNLDDNALHTSYRISVLNEQFVISARRKLIVI